MFLSSEGPVFLDPLSCGASSPTDIQSAFFIAGPLVADLSRDVEHIFGNRADLLSYIGRFRSIRPEIIVDVIAGTRRQAQLLLDTFRGLALRTVVLSSGDVYFANDVLHRKEPGPIQSAPLKETALLRNRRYPYRGLPVPAVSWVDSEDYEKIDVEEVVLSDASLPGTILRLPMVYGPGDYDGMKRRFYAYQKRMDDGREVILLNQAMARWRAPWGYTENVVEAVALAVQNERAAGQIYNVCEEGRPTMADWIRDLAAVTHWPGRILITSKPCPPPDLSGQLNLAQDLDLESSKIRADLGYREPVNRIDALSQTVKWDRQHQHQRIDVAQFDYAAEDALLAKVAHYLAHESCHNKE